MEMHQYSTAPPPGDPQLIDQIVNQIKSQGTFDQWRRECLADVDTKPAYQNLTLRVDNAVASFLGKQRWKPELVKNQVRENLRKHILELGLIEKGVDRIVDQVVQPKVGPLFLPAVECAIYSFLGIKKPEVKKEVKIVNDIHADSSDVQSDTRKAFKPMPVSVPLHQEDDTPPPGDDQFDLEAITPSPDSASDRRYKSQSEAEDIHDDVSDVSMEDVSNQVPAPQKSSRKGDLEPLERICSPISQTSSAGRSTNEKAENRPKARPGSALSAISSGEDLPSSAASPVSSPENAAAEASPLPADSDDESDDSSDEFSSPEFEKLDVIPLSHSVGDIELEDTDSKLVPPGEEVIEEERNAGDQDACKQTTDESRSDRKPDEDEGNLGSRTHGTSTGTSVAAQQQANNYGQSVQETNSSSTTQTTDTEVAQEASDLNMQPPAPEAEESVTTAETAGTAETQKSREKSERSSDSKSRSRTDSHRSDRRDKSSSSSSRKDKKRSDRDRDRDKDRSRDKDRDRNRSERRHSDSKSEHRSSKHKSDRSDREKSKKSSSHKSDRDRSKERHRDRERDRDRDRDRKHRDSERSDRKSDSRKSEGSKSGSSSKQAEAAQPQTEPTAHPKAHLWKRPTEKPKLWEYLAKFPEEVLHDSYLGYLTDVSVSSVSSYDDSDHEEVTTIHLSDVEVDSEMEEAIVLSGGRIVDMAARANVTVPMKCEADDRQGDGGDNKRVRKLNTRYSDSYVGSEWRKMESIITNNPVPTGTLPIRVPMNNNPGKRKADMDFDSCVSGSSPDDDESLSHEVAIPSTAKKLKSSHEPPSSPESVRSNELPMCDGDILADHSLAKDDAKNVSPVGSTSRPYRRSNGMKQPQQRYSDADLYKPRPVITPSSRRSRPNSQTTP